MYYLETGCSDPHYNLAYEEFVLLHRKSGCYFILWQNEDSIIIGQNQNIESEINLSFVEKYKIPVVRRSTGGGAVFHDMGNLNFSFISDRTCDTSSEQYTQKILVALRALGLPAVSSGRNDILINNRKVSGMAERIDGNRILHHGTLLFDADLDKMSCALRPDPEKYMAKGIHSVRARVGNIRDQLSSNLTMNEFWAHMRQSIVSNVSLSSLTAEELEAIRNIAAEKYGSFEWNYGRSPMCQFSQAKRFPGGNLLVHLSVHGGRIAEIRFSGDFLSCRPLDPLCTLLIGCPYNRIALSTALSTQPIAEYFGSLSLHDIINTILGVNSDEL